MLSTAIICVLLGQVSNPQVRPNQNIQIQPSYTVTEPDFIVAPASTLGQAYEISAASTRPDRSFQHGLVVVCGAPKIMVRFTGTAEGKAGTKTGDLMNLPPLNKVAYATDNQAVRLEDNSILVERDSTTYLTPPRGVSVDWASEKVTFFGGLENYARGALAMVRSGDNGKTWSGAPMIDFLTFEGGKYGRPRPMNDGGADVPFDKQGKNPDGTPKWWIGGGDRTEMYACPFSGNLYVTTRIISGPYKKTGENQQNTMLLIGSTDMGKTWKLITTFWAWSPAVMTSTPDGRLWVMQETGNNNTLNVSNPVGRFTLPTTFTKANPTYSGRKTEGPPKVDMELKQGHPSLARLLKDPGGSAVLLSYQVKNEDGNQEFRIVKVVIDSKNQITDSPAGIITAQDPKKQSAMYGAFIQPELVGEPESRYSDDALFYWYDARKEAPGTYGVRYCIFRNGKKSTTGYLSTKDGKPRTWDQRKDPGDYMKGTSYLTSDGRVVFVPVWVEPDGLHTAFISKSK